MLTVRRTSLLLVWTDMNQELTDKNEVDKDHLNQVLERAEHPNATATTVDVATHTPRVQESALQKKALPTARLEAGLS